MLVVGAFVIAGCGAGEPATEPVEPEAAEAAEVADDEGEPVADPVEGPGADDADAADDGGQASPPSSVTAPVGVVYEATGSLNETFGLIQTPEVSVFSNDEVTAYVDDETITVCPEDAGCTRGRREGLELAGLLGGQLVTDVTAFAATMPVASSSSETIAGRDARCVEPEDAEVLQEYCYDLASGIALRWRVIDEGVLTTVVAIEVFEPTPDDLAPDGPVEDREDPAPGATDAGGLDLEDVDLGDLDLADIEGLLGP